MADRQVYIPQDQTVKTKFVDMGDGTWAEIGISAPAIPGAPIHITQATAGNTTLTATLPGAPGKTVYLTGFEVTAGGALAASLAPLTVTGLLGGTATYYFGVPAGVLLGTPPLIVRFDPPVPASGLGVSIGFSLPALGVGNAGASIVAHGFAF